MSTRAAATLEAPTDRNQLAKKRKKKVSENTTTLLDLPTAPATALLTIPENGNGRYAVDPIAASPAVEEEESDEEEDEEDEDEVEESAASTRKKRTFFKLTPELWTKSIALPGYDGTSREYCLDRGITFMKSMGIRTEKEMIEYVKACQYHLHFNASVRKLLKAAKKNPAIRDEVLRQMGAV